MNGKHEGEPHAPVPEEAERVGAEVVDAAFQVHSALGPGLLESVYEACMVHELGKRGLKVQSQVALPITYDGLRIDAGLRLDLVVNGRVIVELKTVEEVLPVHEAQLLTYLKLSGIRLGFLNNFNVSRIKSGIRRMVL